MIAKSVLEILAQELPVVVFRRCALVRSYHARNGRAGYNLPSALQCNFLCLSNVFGGALEF